MGMIETDTTIVAIASPPGPAVRGIVRLSGNDSITVLDRLCDRELPPIRRATRLSVQVDAAAPLGWVPAEVLVWPDARSYTGQPSVEIHTTGSPGVLAAIVTAAIAAGACPAGPGEFTLRAFLAGRLDLTQAEAVLGVIDADDPASLRRSLMQLAGNLSRGFETIRSDLLDLLADVEAGLDFVDEDLQFVTTAEVQARLRASAAQLAAMATQLTTRTGGGAFFEVAIVGPPNVGKSSLLNRIAGRPAAIVSDVSGTTRDAVQITLPGPVPIRLTDTAGVETADPASVLGRAIEQSRAAGRAADLVLHCVAATDPMPPAPPGPNGWVVITKADLAATTSSAREVSSVTGSGIAALIEDLTAAAANHVGGESATGTAARAAASLTDAATAIEASLRASVTGAGDEWVAGEIRLAVTAIGQITGAVHTDDLLDRVFSRFCIGK